MPCEGKAVFEGTEGGRVSGKEFDLMVIGEKPAVDGGGLSLLVSDIFSFGHFFKNLLYI